MRNTIVFWVYLGFICVCLSTVGFAFWDDNDSPGATISSSSELIIKFKPGVHFTGVPNKGGIIQTASGEINSLHSKYEVTAQASLLPARSAAHKRFASMVVIKPGEGVNLEAMAREYEQLNAVEYACPNYPLELYAAPNDPLYTNQWALNNTGQGFFSVVRLGGYNNDTLAVISGVADADIDGLETFENPPAVTDPVVVAILDTGVDYDHPDLADNMWHNAGEVENGIDDDHNGYIDDILGWDFNGFSEYNYGDNQPSDSHGHGTHCAGIVAGVVNNALGIAGATPNARIMALGMIHDFTVVGGVRAITYAADNGADVISMSWGMSWIVPPLEEALDYAREQGTVLIASAGNNGYERINYPAGFSSTIAIAATDWNDHITGFSTYGENINLSAPGYSILSLRAAGTDMYADHNEPNVHIIAEDYYLASGTSMSGPYTAAVAAYVRAVSPGLSPDAVQAVLESSADDYTDPFGEGWNLPGWDKYSGYGRVNLTAAIAAAPRCRAVITQPASFATITGTIDIYGSADGDDFEEYVLEYSEDNDTDTWHTILTSTSPVTAGLLGSWDAPGLGGEFVIRLRVNGDNFDRARVFLGSDPVAEISNPVDGQTVSGLQDFYGSSMCPGFDHAILRFSPDGAPGTIDTIEAITRPIIDGILANWNSVDLAEGSYVVILDVYSDIGLEIADTISVVIKSPFSPPTGWRITAGENLSPSANYADVDMDGENEILVGTETRLIILNTDGTEQTTNVPAFPAGDYRYVMAVGRLDDDGFDDVVAMKGNELCIYRSQYGLTTQAMPFSPAAMTNYSTGFDMKLATVHLKDIDSDGIDEIHLARGIFSPASAGGYYIYDASGAPLDCWTSPGPAFRHCLTADMDGDGIDELYCLNGPDLVQFDECGNFVTSVEVRIDGMELHSVYIAMSAVDIDNDGKAELILTGYPNSTVASYWVFAFDEGLVLEPGWPHDTKVDNFLLVANGPVFGDLDGDGYLEYVISYNHITDGYLLAWHLDGSPVVGDTTSNGFLAGAESPANFTTPVIADVDADNSPDVIVASASGISPVYVFVERVCGFSGNGSTVIGYPIVANEEQTGMCLNMPLIGDIDQDGSVDLVYTTTSEEILFASFPGKAYDPQKAFSPIYSTNRRLNATLIPNGGEYACGDANSDEIINIGDAVYVVNYIFKDGSAPIPLEAGDANCDGIINIGDAVHIVNYVFKNGSGPCCP